MAASYPETYFLSIMEKHPQFKLTPDGKSISCDLKKLRLRPYLCTNVPSIILPLPPQLYNVSVALVERELTVSLVDLSPYHSVHSLFKDHKYYLGNASDGSNVSCPR